MVNIAGLDKAEVLAALVMGTAPIGLGALMHRSIFTIEDAQRTIDARGDGNLRFDYVNGCPIKTDISKDTFDERLYDRDAGQGAAERAIQALRDDTGLAIGTVLPPGQKFDCPFCVGGKCEAVTTEQMAGVLHSLPICETYERMEPDEFLRLVNDSIRRRN